METITRHEIRDPNLCAASLLEAHGRRAWLRRCYVCAQVCSFLSGNGLLTQTRALKYSVLKGFYEYAISRGYASRSPLPANEPKKPPPAPPYVYSLEELRRIFDAIDVSLARAWMLDAKTVRTLLLLLYGAGLRAGEGRRLKVADVDFSEALLTVNRSKFYKTRLIPIGPQLADALKSIREGTCNPPVTSGPGFDVSCQ